MALGIYIPNTDTTIVHSTGVDFTVRPSIFQPVHLVQYDDKLPILAVSMYNNGQEYAAPTNASANIRLGKKNRKFVTNPALGCSTDRKTLYFEITKQMVVEYGTIYPIIELLIGTTVAGSSPICFIIEKNPVQIGDIQSTDEYKTVEELLKDTQEAADSAQSSKESASESEKAAKGYADAAKASEEKATEKATASETSASEAAKSESSAKNYADLANSYARGEGNKRPDEAVDNARYYYEQTLRLSQDYNGITPQRSVTFEELKTVTKKVGYMYNVTDAFTSDDTFNAPGEYYGPGNNVVWTAEEKWDVFAASGVTGIKGNNDAMWSQGNYEITPSKIKLPDTFKAAVEQAAVAPNDSLYTAFSKLARYCQTVEENDKKTPVFGKYEEFPIPGDTGRLYVDDTVDPRLIFTWDVAQEAYVLTGGAGGEGSSMDIPITLTYSGWTGVSAPYSQTVVVPQMREDLTPIHFLNSSDQDEMYAYSLITNYTTGLGSITFYAVEVPTIDINLVLKGVPAQELDYVNNNVLVPVTASSFSQVPGEPTWDSTIPVQGMKSGIGGYWDIVRESGVITRAESELALSIVNVERLDDAIKVSCSKAPTKDFQLLLFETYKEAAEGDNLISGISGLFDRVSKNETGLTGLTGRMTTAESEIESNSSAISKINAEKKLKTSGLLTCSTESIVPGTTFSVTVPIPDGISDVLAVIPVGSAPASSWNRGYAVFTAPSAIYKTINGYIFSGSAPGEQIYEIYYCLLYFE